MKVFHPQINRHRRNEDTGNNKPRTFLYIIQTEKLSLTVYRNSYEVHVVKLQLTGIRNEDTRFLCR